MSKALLFAILLVILLTSCEKKGHTSQAPVRSTQASGGETAAFFKAVRAQNIADMEKYLSAGGNIEARDKIGDTALLMAVRGGSGMRQSLTCLIRNHADVKAQDSSGNPAVVIAVQAGDVSALEQLATAGADLRVTDQGQTLLMIAHSNRAIDMIKALAEAGADPYAKDAKGHTVFDRIDGELNNSPVDSGDEMWDYQNNKPIDDPEKIKAFQDSLKESEKEGQAYAESLERIREILNRARPASESDTSTSTPTMPRFLSLTEPRVHGDDVLAVQKALLSLGFTEVGEADGWYGPQTEAAVKRIQRFYRIKEDGQVKLDTWTVLLSQNPILAGLRADMSLIVGYDIESMNRREEGLSGAAGIQGSVTWHSDDQGLLKYATISLQNDGKRKEYEIYVVHARYIIRDMAELPARPRTYVDMSLYYILNGIAYAITNEQMVCVSGSQNIEPILQVLRGYK